MTRGPRTTFARRQSCFVSRPNRKIMYRLLLSCLLLACAYAQTESVDTIIAQIFNSTEGATQAPGTTTSTTQRSSVKKPESCTTDENQRGVCVLYFLCNTNGYIITNGLGILDIRQRRRRRRSPADDGGEKPVNGSQQPDTATSPSAEDAIDEDFEEGRPLNFIRSKPCLSYAEICCLVSKRPSRPTTDTHAPSHVQKPVCGQRQPDGVGFYHSRQRPTDDAKFAEFPWMVAILRDEPAGDQSDHEARTPPTYVGGGSLIHPSVVLTVAHFLFDKRTHKVRAGVTSLRAFHLGNELYPHQDRPVENVTVHKEYDRSTLIFDIALLFLASPMVMTPNVGVVCLPPQSDRLFASNNCIGSGWGKDKFGKRGKYRTRMKKFNLTLIDRDTCQEQLQQTRLGLFFELHPSFTCADSGSEVGSCQGDGGSPLVCPIAGENMRYQQHGIVSWGIGCGQTDVPTVYVDVSRLRTWIDGAVVAKGLDPKVYTP